MMHPDEGRLLRWLDGAVADDPDLAAHLAACPACRRRLGDLTAEADGWRAALALTPTELALLARARLAGRLVAAAATAAAADQRRRGLIHLTALLGLGLATGLGWALVEQVTGPALAWLGEPRVVFPLALATLAQVIAPLALFLSGDPVGRVAAAVGQLNVVVVVLLGVAAGLHRLRRASVAGSAHRAA